MVSEGDEIIHEVYGIEVKQDKQESRVYWELGGEVYEYEVGETDTFEDIKGKVLESASERLVRVVMYTCVYYILLFLDV